MVERKFAEIKNFKILEIAKTCSFADVTRKRFLILF